MVTQPLSLDNKDWKQDYYTVNYLSPEGEGGKHKNYGGLMRDRPLPRSVRPGANWEDWAPLDFQDEVRTAAKLGIDGFTLWIPSYRPLSGGAADAKKNWESVKLMMQAPQTVDSGFKMILMPDMNTGDFNTTDDTNLTNAIKELSQYPSAYKVNGKVVVSPYATERFPASWWQAWLTKMQSSGTPIYFVPLFADWEANAAAFAPFSDGISDWGDRSPTSNRAHAGDAGKMHKVLVNGVPKRLTAMIPVSPQDFRPRALKFKEARNSENYRVMWEETAIRKGVSDPEEQADWVQIVTWNDYAESTHIAPSTGTQYSFYDLTAYYTTWFKTGQAPAITRDVLYYFHRSQSINAPYNTTLQPAPIARDAGSDTPVDQIELLAFLTQPATLKIQATGSPVSTSAPVGMTSLVAPFDNTYQGKPTFTIQRGTNTTTWRSAFEITTPVVYQDLLYRGGSNTRIPTATAYSNVNFQPDTVTAPGGYLADVGGLYASRGNGYDFGWRTTANLNVRVRNNLTSPDVRYDTLNHMQIGGDRIWEINVPNGVWKVHVVCGDPSNFDGVYKLDAEMGTPSAVRIIDGAQNSPSNVRWIEGTKTVVVQDGKLTLSCASGALNTKICYVDISQW